MSYDLYLNDFETGECIQFDNNHFIKGGTYVLGGTREARLNITYNYGVHYYRILGEKGIRAIYGLTGRESMLVLTEAILKLNSDISNDYWDATEGNAKKALLGLYELAAMAPDGVWDGD
jgi:hypothetical protein